MLFLALAIGFTVLAVRQYKSIPYCCPFKKIWKKALIIVFCGVFAVIFSVLACFGGAEGDTSIISSSNLVGARQNDSTYVFLDENGNTYYITGKLVEVNSNFSPFYDVVVGDFDSPAIQGTRTEMKMTIWSLALFDRVEYRIYIPEDMP